MKMGEIIIENCIKRKPGYLYYVDAEGNLCEAQMMHKGKKKVVPKKKKEDEEA